MSDQDRPRFHRIHDWHKYLGSLQGQEVTGADLYALRRSCYQEIQEQRGRPLLVYATQFLDAPPRAPISIDQTDVDGFTDLIDSVPEGDQVDILLHSPGGSPEATERVVGLIRSRFNWVGFLIPHSAFSAATMMAFAGNEIILHPSATLGPIDPQINGTPARSIRRGFDKVKELLKSEGPEALPAYIPLIEKHSLELLEICDDSLSLSKELASAWLKEYMFEGSSSDIGAIEKAVDYFSSYDSHKTHGRPLTYEKIRGLGLKVQVAENPLKDLLREAHILLSGFFSTTPFVKIFENTDGLSWGRQWQAVPQAPQQQTPAQFESPSRA